MDTITQEMVDKVLEEADIRDEKWWDNLTVVSVKLKNGWTITQSSACVDPANYDHELGKSICMKAIEKEVWKLLGWSLNDDMHGRLI
jgi:hypothetical protein